MLITNWPSTAARCRTVSYRAKRALIVSPGRRANASISVMLVSRLSSSKAANRACKALSRYVTGSTAIPLRTPPWAIS